MSTAGDQADTLYALPPQAFTAARDERVAAARSAGDRALASELAALKRPTAAAWLVNLVALRRPDTIDALVRLGQTIRDAQGNVDATQLRELSARRRAGIDETLALIRSLAAQAGGAPTPAQLTEAEGTLAAAMADPDAARLVRSGRVLKSITYSGFGDLPPSGAAARAAAAAARTRTAGTGSDPAAQAAARAEAQRAAAAARAAAQARVDEARAALAAASGAEDERKRLADDLTRQIAELARRLDGAQLEIRSARQARLAAERDLAGAVRRLDRLG